LAKSLGSRLPEDLALRLYQPNETNARQRVILVTTIDQDGWPRHLMLSHNEVVAKDQSHLLMLTYSDSKSAKNLIRNGVASLLFLDEEMNYYVRVKCKPSVKKIEEAPSETLFNAEVIEVFEDKYPTTKITSGIRFTGFDPGMTEENRKQVFQRLVEL
jgi:general stress protein 26